MVLVLVLVVVFEAVALVLMVAPHPVMEERSLLGPRQTQEEEEEDQEAVALSTTPREFWTWLAAKGTCRQR